MLLSVSVSVKAFNSYFTTMRKSGYEFGSGHAVSVSQSHHNNINGTGSSRLKVVGQENKDY